VRGPLRCFPLEGGDPIPSQLLNDRSELVPLSGLTPHPANPNRGHAEDIAQSIRINGWWGTITAQHSTRRILAGEHRWRGAQLAGLTHVPVFWVDVDDDAALAILLADNAYAAKATRDAASLRRLLDQLAAGRGLDGTGYTPADHEALIKELDGPVNRELLTHEDDVPEIQPNPVTRPGDLWVLGPHRVQCGSSTDAKDLARLVGTGKADLVVTDPPYNVNYEGKTKDHLKIANDAMTPEGFRLFLDAFYAATAAVTREGGCIYVAYAEREGPSFRLAFDENGWRYAQTLVWVKNAGVLGRQDYNWRHEPFLYGWKAGTGHYFNGDFTQTTVIEDRRPLSEYSKAELVALLQEIWDTSTVLHEDKPTRNALHPTMKPVFLFQRLNEASSKPGDTVLDPFGGSGTTLIAAHKVGRRACLNELDPRYVDVIVRRAQDATGLQAVRQDGVSFSSVVAA